MSVNLVKDSDKFSDNFDQSEIGSDNSYSKNIISEKDKVSQQRLHQKKIRKNWLNCRWPLFGKYRRSRETDKVKDFIDRLCKKEQDKYAKKLGKWNNSLRKLQIF